MYPFSDIFAEEFAKFSTLPSFVKNDSYTKIVSQMYIPIITPFNHCSWLQCKISVRYEYKNIYQQLWESDQTVYTFVEIKHHRFYSSLL